MKTQIASVVTLGRSLSPIVHNEVMHFGYEYPKGASKKQRRMPIMVEKDGQVFREEVPVISGNAARGLERRLLIDRTFDALEVNLEGLIGNKEDARRVLFFFRNGGLTPKNTKALKVHVSVYEQTKAKLPFLDLLGGVYQGHHFEGAAKIGVLMPVTKETYSIFSKAIPQKYRDILEGSPLPELNDLTGEVRYTRRAAGGESEDKESMIYGTEVIPAGTYFINWSSVITPYDHTMKAFRAMLWLLSEYGYVGGMSGRGHGQISFDMQYTDNNGSREINQNDYLEYLDYLKKNKQDILETMKNIPELFKWEGKDESEKTAESEEADKKTKGKVKK